MRREIITGLLMGLGAWQLFARSAGANIIGCSSTCAWGVNLQPDTMGIYTSGDNWADIKGTQWGAPAQVVTAVTTDTDSDPVLVVDNDVNNDTDFTWTGYDVTVSMPNPFSLYNAEVTNPANWTATVTAPTEISPGEYEGAIDYAAGTPILVGGELDFQYTLQFTGATSYSFTESVTPVPEPASIGLLTMGVVALLARRKRA
ncbi:MAG: PEP-CTERM sorting domain-containing protein [Tepidisphaeraceae bacterium]|jgi:hypothetical protein